MSWNIKRSVKRIRNLVIEPRRNKQLVFESAVFTYPRVEFTYRVGRTRYREHLVLDGIPAADFEGRDKAVLARIFRDIGIVRAPFFWRTADFISVAVEDGPLPAGARAHYESYFRQGLAELRYVQGLDPRRPIRLEADYVEDSEVPTIQPQRKALLLNGGGKDTVVAAELLKAMGVPFAWFTLHMNAVRQGVIDASGRSESYHLSWHGDGRVAKDARYGWGSLPHGSMVHSLSLLPAYLYGFQYVLAGNECSANIGNTFYRGMEVNHQYSKCFSAEVAFDEHANAHVLAGPRHISLLRPFHDLRLAQMFAGCDAYLDAFVSCNRGIKEARWCKACPKCAFVFLALCPFLDRAGLQRIFGEDLWQRRVIREEIVKLIRANVRPWECVGTVLECTLALRLCLDKYPDMDFAEDPNRADLEACCAGFDAVAARREVLEGFHEPHRIPGELVSALQASAQSL